jgi:hypothetical protein
MKTLASRVNEFERLLQESPDVRGVAIYFYDNVGAYRTFIKESERASANDRAMMAIIAKKYLEELSGRNDLTVAPNMVLLNEETGIVHGIMNILEEGTEIQLAFSKRIDQGIVVVQNPPQPMDQDRVHYIRVSWLPMPY